MNVSRTVSALGVALLLIIGLASLKTYYVREPDTGGELLWSSDEAFLFIGTARQGWHGNYLQLVWRDIREILRLVNEPKISRPSVHVFRISEKGLEHHHLMNTQIGAYTVFEGSIYELTGRRWTGTQFEASNPERQRSIAKALSQEWSTSGEWSNDDGWSKRCCVTRRSDGEQRFPILLRGQELQVVVSADGGSLSVDLQRPGQALQRIWSVDREPRRVTRAEYEAFLSQ
jgi:hypothetical protein